MFIKYYNLNFFFIKLRIRAEDGGQPAKYAETVVTVTVNRNEASPVFSKDYSSLEIKENFPIGGTIATITAIDKDVVMNYLIPITS